MDCSESLSINFLRNFAVALKDSIRSLNMYALRIVFIMKHNTKERAHGIGYCYIWHRGFQTLSEGHIFTKEN